MLEHIESESPITHTLGENAVITLSICNEADGLLYYDNKPYVGINGYISIGIELDREKRYKIKMTKEQAKAIRKGLKMQINRLVK